ncbi:uncharacterized protein LOC123204187 isoform X1 [Mangifera indica]|uniref:uncharacterized protein LOC123204187 isoform X1 n=1 Tax=Mangifera indica TaxID=29780 RepID=UPI001CFAE6EA|nr:uncharacterized protein LOC123204187 isoform X1 [Mangifera indica]XP_044476706.1 uncharacterized protein LOC123204187 isoform X1 [Mangifera indica]XP_044476707.1 uncharacterized protein LOC123204187 isoform X1 [Mangifera indica]
MADQGLDLAPLGLHLSRHGTGRLTHLPCENGKGYVPYVKNILKKLSVEAESNHGDVLDELYEQYAYIMTSLKDEHLAEKNKKLCKNITFLFPDRNNYYLCDICDLGLVGMFDLSSCPTSRKLLVPLQCSLNMLEGDTGLSCIELRRHLMKQNLYIRRP